MMPAVASASRHDDGLIAPAATIASAVAAVVVALWLIPASIQIIAWPVAGPDRVAYVAPVRGLLMLCAAAAAVLAFAFGVFGWRPILQSARNVAPLQWLWLWTVPFWPVVPDRLPLLLILAGPLRWFVAAAAVLVVLLRLKSEHGDAATQLRFAPTLVGAVTLEGNALRRTVFGVSLALYLVAGLAWNADVGFSGDEPHYLVIAHSLLTDHDLDIENNHARHDYASFYPGTLRPDYLARGRHGEIYSIHAPGLPAILLPAYAVAGGRGAIAFVAAIAALGALAIFDAAVVLAGTGAACVTWVAVCLTVPFLPHAWLIYPEIVALLIVAWTIRWLVTPIPDGIGRWVARGLALGLLPWLHTKYAILLAPLALFVAADAWWRGTPPARVRRLLAFAVPIAVSLVGWLASFYVMYGVLDPQAPYGSYTAMYVRTSNIARGVFGLLVDQKFGLLVYAPAYLLAAFGAWSIVRRRERRLLKWTVAVTGVLFVASTARFYMWWGGASAPGRFLVPVLPLAAPLVAIAVGEWRRLAGVTIAISLAISLTAAARPSAQILFSDPHGESRVMTWLQGPAPLTSAWPTFTEPEWRPQLGRAVRAVIGRFDPAARQQTIERGRESLLLHDDPGRLRAFDYARRARADEAFVLSQATLTRTRHDGELNDDPARLAGPFNLAAGNYAVRAWFAGEPAPVYVHYHRSPAIATFAPARTTAVEGELQLPVDAPVIWVGVSDPSAAARVERVDVVPVLIVPAAARLPVEPIAIEPLNDRALLVYADRNSYPEGGVFWTRGTRQATVYVAPAGASRLVASIHVGPNAGTVNLRVGGEVRQVGLPAGGTGDVSIPIDTRAGVVPVTVEAPDSFVPATIDPHSDDTRQLGCQVRITLR